MAALPTDLVIRPARPDAEDGEQFARYFDIAGDGLLQWMFGPRYVGIVGRAFLERGHDMSYEHVWFAESEGSIAGMVSGYSAADHAGSKDGPLFRAAGMGAIRLVATWLIARPLFEFMNRVPVGDWYLQSVAVDESHRGQGIGSALLDHAERIASDAQSVRLALDVDVDNDGARTLYERRGMVIDATSPSSSFGPGHGVHRMTKPL